MATMVSENKAKEIAAANNKAEDDVLDGAWTYDAVPVTEQKAKALYNTERISELPLSCSKLWVVEVYDETGEYMGTL